MGDVVGLGFGTSTDTSFQGQFRSRKGGGPEDGVKGELTGGTVFQVLKSSLTVLP